jgi:hypothetical protein
MPPDRLATAIHASANAETVADAARPTVGHGAIAVLAVQAMTMTAAAIAPAICTTVVRVASDVALVASVITANVPKSGHGGSAHSRFTAMKKRNRWPMSDRYRPFAKLAAVSARVRREAHE